jgi:glutamine synthetase
MIEIEQHLFYRKFEFRAVGSTANCSNAMTTSNTIVAKQSKTLRKK